MLQLTFHNLVPDCSLLGMAERAYLALRAKHDPRLENRCLSVTVLDRGPAARTPVRAIVACVHEGEAVISVITEGATPEAALRSAFAVLTGWARPHSTSASMTPMNDVRGAIRPLRRMSGAPAPAGAAPSGECVTQEAV